MQPGDVAASDAEMPRAAAAAIGAEAPCERGAAVCRRHSKSIGIRRWSRATDAVRTLDDVRRTLERDPEAARAAAVRLVRLLTPPANGEPPCARGGLAPWQQRAVGRYMRQRLERPLRVKELAGLATLSVSHFCRTFRKSFGTTPRLHLIRLRVERAQQLMLTTSDPLSQIALACGMADQAHLSKVFRRTVGETPSGWRRRNRIGG
jgi:AraC-like DNA-binding protein